MCALWKAARAGRNSDVTGESGGVSEVVVGLSLQCAKQPNITAKSMPLKLFLYLCLFISLLNLMFQGFCLTAIKKFKFTSNREASEGRKSSALILFS